MTVTKSFDDGRLLRVPEVLKALGISRTTLYRQINAGFFPAGIHIGPNSVAWPLYEVVKIRDARIAGKTDVYIADLVTQLIGARG